MVRRHNFMDAGENATDNMDAAEERADLTKLDPESRKLWEEIDKPALIVETWTLNSKEVKQTSRKADVDIDAVRDIIVAEWTAQGKPSNAEIVKCQDPADSPITEGAVDRTINRGAKSATPPLKAICRRLKIDIDSLLSGKLVKLTETPSARTDPFLEGHLVDLAKAVAAKGDSKTKEAIKKLTEMLSSQ